MEISSKYEFCKIDPWSSQRHVCNEPSRSILPPSDQKILGSNPARGEILGLNMYIAILF
jgi:hypothetical protein